MSCPPARRVPWPADMERARCASGMCGIRWLALAGLAALVRLTGRGARRIRATLQRAP